MFIISVSTGFLPGRNHVRPRGGLVGSNLPFLQSLLFLKFLLFLLLLHIAPCGFRGRAQGLPETFTRQHVDRKLHQTCPVFWMPNKPVPSIHDVSASLPYGRARSRRRRTLLSRLPCGFKCRWVITRRYAFQGLRGRRGSLPLFR